MKKGIFVNFKDEALLNYQKLQEMALEEDNKKSYSVLLRSLNKAIDNLKHNPFIGDKIPRRYIPKNTARLYETNKLYRIELSGYWRLIYTIIGDEIKIIALILEFMNHKEYDKRFNYRKK